MHGVGNRTDDTNNLGGCGDVDPIAVVELLLLWCSTMAWGLSLPLEDVRVSVVVVVVPSPKNIPCSKSGAGVVVVVLVVVAAVPDLVVGRWPPLWLGSIMVSMLGTVGTFGTTSSSFMAELMRGYSSRLRLVVSINGCSSFKRFGLFVRPFVLGLIGGVNN